VRQVRMFANVPESATHFAVHRSPFGNLETNVHGVSVDSGDAAPEWSLYVQLGHGFQVSYETYCPCSLEESTSRWTLECRPF